MNWQRFTDPRPFTTADLQEAMQGVAEAANGDSNDQHIDALNLALNVAINMLGDANVLNLEELVQ